MIPPSIKSYVMAGALALAAAGWTAAGVQTYRIRGIELDAAEKRATDMESARLKERAQQIDTSRIRDEKDDQIRQVAAERDRFASELRKRADRLPETSRASCAGATGAELANPDARFLEGYGAFARSLQVELHACQKREAIGAGQ
jgi:hypothetical protein